jgi:hypothetical protein
MMEERFINVEHSDGTMGGFGQHYQQHFRQHYTASADGSPIPPMQVTGGGGGGPPFNSYETRSQLFETDANGNVRKVEEKQSSKKTVQTTTTTISQQPTIVIGQQQPPMIHSMSLVDGPVNFTNSSAHATQSYHTHAPIPVYAVNDTAYLTNNSASGAGYYRAGGGGGGGVAVVNNNNTNSNEQTPYGGAGGGITVEHYPHNASAFNWTNMDTYLHIFLTFYFGHFAAMLFFDGIVRNFVNLYLFEHRDLSMLIYIFHIILSIALLAFTIWFMTICWRWWRHKSLLPVAYSGRPVLGPKERQATFHGYVFTAAFILIVGLFLFLILSVLDLSFKHELATVQLRYARSAYIGDCVVFLLRLVFWLVGIVVTLLLSRDVLYKYFCPSKRIRINKEKPTTVYQVRS